MNNIENFKNFNPSPRDLVMYKGMRAQVLSKAGTGKFLIRTLPKRDEIIVNVFDLEPLKFCIGECAREIVEIDNERAIYCPSCDRVMRRM